MAGRIPLLLVGFSTILLALVLLGSDPGEDESARDFWATFGRYAVAADHPEASRAGAQVLAAGGSAADAAAATMLALGVVNPASSGLGGGGFALYWDAEAEELTYLDFREEAPAASTADMFANAEERSGEGRLAQPSQLGGLATGVPGEPAGIEALLERFGKLPRERVVAPALRLASEGMEVSPPLARVSGYFAAQMKKDPTMRGWFPAGANALEPGQKLVQRELARTLGDFARDGAQAFYRGRVAREIVRANRRAGGIMTARDLRDYRVVEREPVVGERFGHRWASSPPPSAGGYSMLHSLALLELWAPRWKGGSAADRLHALAESWKGPYLDRQAYMGDPDHVDVPLERMMARERIEERARAFHPTLAMAPEDYEVPVEGFEPADAVQPEGGGTSHLCVVDADGNVASITTTVNLPFGARYTAAGAVMNDEMDDFARELGKPNAFGLPGGAPNLPGPGRRPVSSMSPTIVLGSDGPVLCAGASGGSRIITATQQVALNALVLGMELSEAVAAPRIHHQGVPNELRTELFARLADDSLAQLEARGHVHRPIDNVAVVQAIHLVRGEDGTRSLVAASDPRKYGKPAGE